MNLKRAAVAALTTVALMLGATAANAAVYWPTAADGLSKTTFAVDSQENFVSSQGYSTLFNSKDQLCETLGEAPCANVSTDIFNGSYVLPVCTNANQILCLDTVNIYKGAVAKHLHPPDRCTYRPGQRGHRNRGHPCRWSDQPLDRRRWQNLCRECRGSGSDHQWQANRQHVRRNRQPLHLDHRFIHRGQDHQGRAKTYIDDQHELNCAWSEAGVCGELQDFDLGTRVGLTFRLGKPTAQFLNARLAKPTINVGKAADTNQIALSIDGAPVSVQQLSLKLPTSNVPKGLNVGGTPKGLFDYSLDTTANVTALRTAAGNKASGTRTFWQVTNQDDTRINQPTKCKAASGIAGLVATDAMIADPFNPVKTGGALKQTINGLLNNPDGKADSALSTLFWPMTSPAAPLG